MVGVVALERPTPRQPRILAAMSTVSELIPVERLWELYDYNPLTGELISRKTGRPRKGFFHARRDNLNIWHGGRIHCIGYGAAVYAWCVGHWAEPTIDHVDQNPKNHTFQNLRPATRRQQNQNKKTFTGGATYRKDRNTWFARITVHGTTHHLGTFKTEAEAQAAYATALSELVS